MRHYRLMRIRWIPRHKRRAVRELYRKEKVPQILVEVHSVMALHRLRYHPEPFPDGKVAEKLVEGPVQREGEPVSGLDCLRRIRERFRHAVWLNPGERPAWGEEWTRTYDVIQDLFPMYPLTVEGLEQGMRKLLAR